MAAWVAQIDGYDLKRSQMDLSYRGTSQYFCCHDSRIYRRLPSKLYHDVRSFPGARTAYRFFCRLANPNFLAGSQHDYCRDGQQSLNAHNQQKDDRAGSQVGVKVKNYNNYLF